MMKTNFPKTTETSIFTQTKRTPVSQQTIQQHDLRSVLVPCQTTKKLQKKQNISNIKQRYEKYNEQMRRCSRKRM